jgi:phosphoesterase RecJ-like protein
MTTLVKNNWDALTSLIEQSKSIILSTHMNGDGDGIGSEIAFYYFLKDMGKECRIINATPTPENLNIIDPESIVEVYDSALDDWLNKVDLTIVFDIGDHRRTGPIGEKVYEHSTVISLDHHPAKEGHPFDLNIVHSEAPATGYMIWKYMEYLGKTKSKLPIKIANALYAAVVTDTGSFKYQSTTADTHLMAAHLLESGVDGYDIQKSIYEQNKLSRIRLMGIIIQNLHYSDNGQVVWSIITQEMLKQADADDSDVDGFTEFIRTIEGVEVSFMIQETKDGKHRINFRSSGNYIINDIAQSFDGGGHKFAAGARVDDLSSDEIESIIVTKLAIKINGEFDGYKK